MSRGKVLTVVIVIVLLIACGVVSIVIIKIGLKGKESQPTLPPPTGIIYRADKVDVKLLVELPPNTKVTSVWADFLVTGNILVGDDKGRVWLLKFENQKERR